MRNTTLPKQAADDQIEGAFFQLAYQRLQDTLKNLIPFLVGFEIVKKNEDNTKALGVFGFRSKSGQILYVPAFFINGKVKNLDLLYSKNNEQFYPLNEDFAEMFIKDEMLGIGENSREQRADIMRDATQGDYRQMSVPPRTGRYAIASVLDYVEAGDNPTKKAFTELIEKDAEFCEAVLRFYPLEKVAKAIALEDGDKYRKSDKASKKLNLVKVVKTTDKDEVKKLTQSDKETLLTQGYVIVDDRAQDEKSTYGAVDYIKKFTNPDESGFYSYITRLGGLRYGLLIVRPKQLQQDFATDDTLVVDLDSKDGTTYIKDHQGVFIKDQIRVQDYSAAHKMMVDVAEGKPGYTNVYILINENLKATQPFRINANFKDASGIRRISVEPYSEANWCSRDDKGGKWDKPGSVHDLPRGNYYEHPKKMKEVMLVMTKRQSDRLEYKDKMIYVPAGYKLLKINPADHNRPVMPLYPELSPSISKKDKEDMDKRKQEAESEKEKLMRGEPGYPGTLHGLLKDKNIFPMTVHTNGSEYFIDVDGAKKKYEDPIKAKIAMVVELGLDEKTASDLLDSLTPGFTKKGHIKIAYTGDIYPQPFEEQPFTNEFGQSTTVGVGQENVLPTMDSYTGNPTRQDLGTMPEIKGIDPKYVTQAIQLAQNGQKEIFDTHMIGALAKYVSVGDKVSEYLPSLVESMDRLGRILFLLHWETDKFKEMYGRSDLPELVELVTSVFKNTGDLIIFLKRKSPELSINMSKADGLDV
jgi:hypothetical protein